MQEHINPRSGCNNQTFWHAHFYGWIESLIIRLFSEYPHEHWTPSMRSIPTFSVRIGWCEASSTTVSSPTLKKTIHPPDVWGLTGHEVCKFYVKKVSSPRTAGSSCFSPHSGSLSFQLMTIPILLLKQVNSPVFRWRKKRWIH